MLPAVCQGVIALETRAGDPLADDLAALDDPDARTAATAERAFLLGLGGDCTTPLAAWARIEGDRVHLEALLCSSDGARLVRVRHETAREAAERAGAAAAHEVLARGGQELLDALRREAE
jgi:hydroxymethylbilane synthase